MSGSFKEQTLGNIMNTILLIGTTLIDFNSPHALHDTVNTNLIFDKQAWVQQKPALRNPKIVKIK